MRIKKECLKLFKVADVSLSLKRWLALKGRQKISDGRFFIIVCGYPLSIKCSLKFEILSSNAVFEELVHRIVKASP